MDKNVMIPISLLEKIVEFLDSLELPEYHELRCDYCDILWALRVKKQKLELRDAYAKIISADNQDARDEARIHYLQEKRWLHNMEDDPF